MSTPDFNDDVDAAERIARYIALHPDATVPGVLGELSLSPATWSDDVADALDADDPRAALGIGDGPGTESHPSDSNEDRPCGVTADADTPRVPSETGGSDGHPVSDETAGESTEGAGDSDANPTPDAERIRAEARAVAGPEDGVDDTPGTDEPLGESYTPEPGHISGAGEVADSDLKNGARDGGRGGSSSNKARNSDSCTPDAGAWDAAAFDAPGSDVYPPALLEREQWMGRQGKLPFAPWGDRDAGLECSHNTCPEHGDDTPEDIVADCPDCQAHRSDGSVTTAECAHDARYKWGHGGHYVDGDTVAKAEVDPRLDGRVFLQRDRDPFAFVDGDDVRDPETGDVHPEFVRILEELGCTYADVSTSGSGVHAYYRGDLPDDCNGQAVFEIDTEPWGANDDAPTVEIYANKHVCVATGEHVPNTPVEVSEWDTGALDTVLDDYLDPEDRRPDDVAHDTDRERDDLEDYDPDATAGESADDIRDLLYAVDRLRARDLPLRTRKVGTDATGWEKWNPSSYRTSSGNDSLHKPAGEPVFHDHKHGESFGVLSLFAAERGIISKPWHRLDGGDWWAAVDAARDAGAPIPEYSGGDDVAHTPLLPESATLDTATSGWDWRNAGEESDLSIDAARERTTDAIADAYERGDRVLVEALPTMGKSYGAVAAAAETDEPVTILTGRGRKEQYDQFKEWCADHGLTYKELPSFTHDCPTAAGEHGAEWAETVTDWYRRGATPQAIHKFAEDVLGRPLPCQANEDTGERHECSYAAKWRFDPDEHPDTGEAWDVLIGHYTHAYKEKVTTGRTVVFDEFPDGAYETRLSGRLQSAVSYWLSTVDAVPFDDYTDLIENRDDDARRADALAWFLDDDGGGLDTDETQVFDDESAHAAAPLAAFAILAGDDLGNGFESADLQDVGTAAFDRAEGEVSILQPPSLEYASAVVALDGTPTKRMWELSLGGHLNHRPVLAEGERTEYIRDVLNLNLVRTTDAVKPYNSSDHVAVDRDAALLEKIADTHGQRPALITSSTAKDEYDAAGVLDDVGDTKHYGNVLGSNEFKTTRLGAVIGSNHYGDGFIKKWGAYAGHAVQREDTSQDGKGRALSYGEFGDRVLTHMREHDTLQAAMRFGRDGNGAVVYVHTDTLPEWVPLAGEGRVVSTWSDGMKGVLDAVGDLGRATAAEIAAHPAVDVGKRQVFDHLETLRDRGVLGREQDPSDGRRYIWQDAGVHEIGEHGDVDLAPVEIEELDANVVDELARSSVYTCEFTHSGGSTPSTDGHGDGRGATHPDRSVSGADPPPGPGD
jgi:hypothetical protein